MKDAKQTDSFKRAVADAVRSLAADPEIDVTFSPEHPMLNGKNVRLLLPSRSLTADDVAAVRGAGDAYALKLAYHEDHLDNDIRPVSGNANAIYDAVEQARVDAIGALVMPGVKDNLAAHLALRCKALGLGGVAEQTQVPLRDVLPLLVRERLTGEAPPQIAERAIDLWRPVVEAKVGLELDRLKEHIRDQRSFGKLTRTILSGLELADEYIDEPEDGEKQERSRQVRTKSEEPSRREDPHSQIEADKADDGDSQETREGERPNRPDLPPQDVERCDYRVFTAQFDETVSADELCDAEELTRLRNFLEQPLASARGLV